MLRKVRLLRSYSDTSSTLKYLNYFFLQVESNLIAFLDQNFGVFGSYIIDSKSISLSGK